MDLGVDTMLWLMSLGFCVVLPLSAKPSRSLVSKHVKRDDERRNVNQKSVLSINVVIACYWLTTLIKGDLKITLISI